MVSADFGLGFMAGEASFVVGRTWGNGKPYVRPLFHIQLDSGDAYLLSEVRELFSNVGNITESNGVVRWEVTSAEELQALVDKIDEYEAGPWFASKKREAYQTWRKIVDIYTSGPCNDQDRVNMVKIAEDEELNVGSGGADADHQVVLDWYAENRNVYPDSERNMGTQ